MDLYSNSIELSFNSNDADAHEPVVDSPYVRGPAEPSEIEGYMGQDDRDVQAGLDMLLHAELTRGERERIRNALTEYVRGEVPPELQEQAEFLLGEMIDDQENGN
jgi:hypothetical protein